MTISENILVVRERISRAARKAGRHTDELVLMAVTKTHPAERIVEAYDAGIRVFGENRVQEFAGKADRLNGLAGAQWHMIGHLQTNKASKALDLFTAVDSVDSLKLAEKLDAAAHVLGKTLSVLIEVNVGGEAAKSGVTPESRDMEEVLMAASRFKNLEFLGLMAVPPYTEDPEGARPYFRRLRELRDTLARRRIAAVGMDRLSMGMSHDFEVAIEEGSTCVRVGTAIFGARTRL